MAASQEELVAKHETLISSLEKKSKCAPLRTVEMHTGGEPVRIIVSGLQVQREGSQTTILQKRAAAMEKEDHIRKLLMHEPRGHYDMYGAVLVQPDLPAAHLAALFTHNAGFGTMCGHAVIALGRYAVDLGLVPAQEPETRVNIQCPCGLVPCFVAVQQGVPRSVRFNSVPAFVFALDVPLQIDGYGKFTVDISYGGAFYAFVPASVLGLDILKSKTHEIVEAADRVSAATRAAVQVTHPTEPDLSFLYGTIVVDDEEPAAEQPLYNQCIFADRQADRSPCGSGVTARVALLYRRKQLGLGRKREFRNPLTGSVFMGQAVREEGGGAGTSAVVVEVSGSAHYSGAASFILEPEDELPHFLPS